MFIHDAIIAVKQVLYPISRLGRLISQPHRMHTPFLTTESRIWPSGVVRNLSVDALTG